MKLTKILPLALLTVGLTSCLDDEPIVGDPTTVDNIIEFHDRASASPSAGFFR